MPHPAPRASTTTDPESGAGRAGRRHSIQVAAIATAVVVLDGTLKRLTRALLERGAAWPADDWPLRFVHVVNTGAAFGKLQGQTSLLVMASAVGIVVFAYMLLRTRQRRLSRLGLAMGLGGAVANFVDRVSSGEVIDSIKVDYWPAFNLADVALTVGISLVLWDAIRPNPERPPHPPPLPGGLT
ncbi:MAG: signal peptidase II [Thermoflexaceae bacterium]|nr:signal peptidase II [Thermoflexaceae bacterium]